MDHKFQINLGGIIDLLSNHLYSSPAVYLRELLQNGVDAIRARQHVDPNHQGSIRLELQSHDSSPQLIFQDNGVGLTEAETHRFLATIGESSKRLVEDTRQDFIGQFGIGLLSCFIVSDEIIMVTRSAQKSEHAVQWRGRADGTYEVSNVDDQSEVGTTVYLKCKKGMEDWFAASRVEELVRHYGSLLPYPVVLTTPSDSKTLNDPNVPWRQQFETRQEEWIAQMDFGRRIFGQEFFDCIPLRSEVGQVQGVAFILPYSPNPTAKRAHRVYLKNMLLSEASENILPSWAFFVTCVVNTHGLRPVASREAFYEDEMLHQTRDTLGKCLKNYLVNLRRHDPQRLQKLIAIHFRAIKALATHDDEFFAMFIDVLPFETSQGHMSMGNFRARNSSIKYVESVDTFRQIAQVAASQGLGIINAGYSYDAELVQKLSSVFDVEVERIDSQDLAQNFEDLLAEEQADVFELITFSDVTLQPHKCRTDIKKFFPVELPALFLTNEEGKFQRQMDLTQEVASPHWTEILGAIAGTELGSQQPRLCLNYRNPLIRKLARVHDQRVLRTSIQMLYLQSLLMGHHPLNAMEMGLLNTGLIDLIELSLSNAQGGWIQ